MIDINITIKEGFSARVIAGQYLPWIAVEDATLNAINVFMPAGVSLEKLQTIADAIADALDSVKQKEAA